MRSRSSRRSFVVMLLAVISTLDASRIFYLPLPKMHLSNSEPNSPKAKPINDELISISAMESNLYDEQQVNEKRDNEDWEPLFGKTSKHHITVNERSHENQRRLNYLLTLSQETDPSTDTKSYDEAETDIDRFSQSKQNNLDNQDWSVEDATARAQRLQSSDDLQDSERSRRRNDALFLTIVGVCTLVGILGLVAAAIFWYRIQKRAESALDAEYPSYGVTGPGNNGTKISPSTTMSDRKLAQSAQMFHYQQQRQQMMAQEKAHLDTKPAHSDDSDDEAPNGGDYTVYECPGLAPTGEMEVRNPLFAEPESSTPAPHPATNNHYPQLTTSTPSTSPPKEKPLS